MLFSRQPLHRSRAHRTCSCGMCGVGKPTDRPHRSARERWVMQTLIFWMCLAAIACATTRPYTFDAAGQYGMTWVPSGLASAEPPYPSDARQAGVTGEVTFAALLSDSGAVDARTLSVIAVSNVKVLAFACPWMKHAHFRNAEPGVRLRPGWNLTAVTIRYASDQPFGRVIRAPDASWGSVQKIAQVGSMAKIREGVPQCR